MNEARGGANVLEEQAKFAEQMKVVAAGKELGARLAGNEASTPKVVTEAERRNSEQAEQRLAGLRQDLRLAEASIQGLNPKLIQPQTLEYIDGIKTQIQTLEGQLAANISEGTPGPDTHELTEDHEIGAEKLAELAARERKMVEDYGRWLAGQDREDLFSDRPRRELRADLVGNRLLLDFLHACEQNAYQRLKEAQNDVYPAAVYREVADTVDTLSSQLSNVGYTQRDYPTLSSQFSQDSQGMDAFYFYLLCNNRNVNIHVGQSNQPSDRNRVRFYHDEVKKDPYGRGPVRIETSTYPTGGSLNRFFERFPTVARKVALIQAAERAAGERQSMFGGSVVPPYELTESDNAELEAITEDFKVMNESRRAYIAEELQRTDELAQAIEAAERLKGEVENYKAAQAQLETAQSSLTSSTALLEQARRKLEDTPPQKNVLDFKGKKAYQEAQAAVVSAEQVQAQANRNVTRLQSTVGGYAAQYGATSDILRKYGLYLQTSGSEMRQRLTTERGELERMKSFLAREPRLTQGS